MPDFETTVDIDVCEFLDSCTRSEKEDALEYLIEEATGSERLQNFLKDKLAANFPGSPFGSENAALGGRNMSYDQEEFIGSLHKLNSAYYQLSKEDIDTLNNMAKRF